MRKQRKEGRQTGEIRRYKQLYDSIREVFGPYDSSELASYLARWRREAFESGGMFDSPRLFRHMYLRAEGLKRFQEGTIRDSEKEKAAIQQFFEIERACEATNVRLHDACNKSSTPDDIRTWLIKARSILEGILGPWRWERFAHQCRFSGGASTEGSRAESHPSIKWGSASQITYRAVPYWQAYTAWSNLTMRDLDTGTTWDDVSREVEVVVSNAVFTVVKNFEKKRTAAKEPPLNMFLQLGLGGYIRWCLNREGLLLPDAQQLHQRLAREGSVSGTLVTRDLRAASDSVCTGHIEELWPQAFGDAILDLRSPCGQWKGKAFPYHKVSSMGNGSTFEVETATFYALVRAVCGRGAVVSVYGDDIIYPVEFEEAVTRLFDFCGFATNTDKTFAIGPFRESCGGHYFRGEDVTPFYIQRLPTTIPEVIDLHNRACEWAERDGSDAIVRPILHACRRLVPRKHWGPRSETGVLWCEWDEACPTYDTDRQCWSVVGFQRKVLQQRHDYFVGGLLAQLVGRDGNPVGGYVARDLPGHAPGNTGNPGAWANYLTGQAYLTAHADREAADALEKSVFKFQQVTYKKRRILLRCNRQWTGPKFARTEAVSTNVR